MEAGQTTEVNYIKEHHAVVSGPVGTHGKHSRRSLRDTS